MNIPSTYLKFIYQNPDKHPKQQIPIMALLYNFITKKYTHYNFSHIDKQQTCTFNYFKNNIINKKSFIVKNAKKYQYHITNKLYDINIILFLNGKLNTSKKSNIIKCAYKHNNSNIVPYAVYQRIFKNEVKEIISLLLNKSYDYRAYMFYSDLSKSLYEIEKNGLHVNQTLLKQHFNVSSKDNIIYSLYNIYNIAGRPSNAFNNINFLALNKQTNCRETFISRYENGKLILIDFKGYHPSILAKLTNYKIPKGDTIYTHLCKEYYNTTNVTDEMLQKIKQVVMYYLYGNTTDDTNIVFFNNVNNLKNQYWNLITTQNYVETPIYKRKIRKNMIENNNPGKMLSYIIQATETELNISNLNKCISYCKGRCIKPILYVYDSILFDVKNISSTLYNDLRLLLENDIFKIRIYVGDNYNNMVLVDK